MGTIYFSFFFFRLMFHKIVLETVALRLYVAFPFLPPPVCYILNFPIALRDSFWVVGNLHFTDSLGYVLILHIILVLMGYTLRLTTLENHGIVNIQC